MSETNTAVERALEVIKCLKGRNLHGLSHKEIADKTKLPPATVTRILATLIKKDFAIQLDNGRYALSVALLGIAQAFADEMTRGQHDINQLTQRVQSSARQ